MRDARELIEPAEVVGQGCDVALLGTAEVGVGGRCVRGLAALGQLGGQVGPPPLEEAEPGDGFEEAAERAAVEGRSSEGSALTRSSRRRVSPLSVLPYTLRLRFSSRRPDFSAGPAGELGIRFFSS